MGKIGRVEAQLFKGLGAEVHGYDIVQSPEAQEIVSFLDLDQVLTNCDIISLHLAK